MTAITSTTIVITTKTNTTGTSTAPIARAGGKSLRRFAPFFLKKTTDHNDVDSRRPLTENVVSYLNLESRFYAVVSKAASSGLALNPRRSKSREPKRPKGRDSVRISRKDRNGVRTPSRNIMNEFTGKNEQAFLDACGAIGAEPKAMFNTQKERYLVSEFLKKPVLWLESEILYYSYTTRGEAQEVANGIDRMISENAPVGQSNLFPRPKHSSGLSDTAFGS
jgi:hypothetical protein